MTNLKRFYKNLPDSPGIYKFLNSQKKIIYIGKAKSLKKRVASYFSGKNLGPKTNLMVSKIAKVEYVKVFSEFEALMLEASLIRQNQPFFNAIAKDDKSPLYIKITDGHIPLVTTVRNEKSKRGVFLKGPFPSARVAGDVLKITRKIFPYCHHKNPKKPCLFVHLGLCPYPYVSELTKNLYRKNVTRIKKLLSGQTKVLISDLKKEMNLFSKAQKYEEASETKDKIKSLEFLRETYRSPREFLEKPTLVDDVTAAKLKDLQSALKLEKLPRRIECYDISNISGRLATGSMVVFESGRPAKDQYRRFKIKISTRPDDYQMLKEVLNRRFKNNWQLPSLIIIDGGRGQLNSAITVINKLKLNTPVVSLAKKHEEIYLPQKPIPLRLPNESLARQLVQQIRDEAHRFAINYHKLLRSKNFLN